MGKFAQTVHISVVNCDCASMFLRIYFFGLENPDYDYNCAGLNRILKVY